jgi:hypothetical protein
MRGNARAQAPPGSGAKAGRDTIAGYALRLATAAALVIDAVVHLQDAHFYDVSVGSFLLTEGQLFRVQAGVAIAGALLVLVWPRWPSWLFALLVAGSAVTAVVTYTYVNIGPIGGLLPNMYEPSWGPPDKVFSAYAEGAGALLALAGLVYTLARARRAARERAQAGEAQDGRLAPAPHG